MAYIQGTTPPPHRQGALDDNYVHQYFESNTQTPMPMRKQSTQRRSTQWCLDKETTAPKKNTENL
jgi:hypothetical protein